MGQENDHQQDQSGPESLNHSLGTSKRSGRKEHHLDQFRRLLGPSNAVAQAKPNEEGPHSKALQSPLFQPYTRLLNSIAFGINGDRIVKGASAPYVAALQMALQQLFPSFQPGKFGTHDAETVGVTEQFQSKESLKVDGEIGKDTLLALDAYGFSRINEQGKTDRVDGHEIAAELNQPAKITATANELNIASRKTQHTHQDKGADKGMHHGTVIDGIRVYSGPETQSKLKFTVAYNQDVTLVGIYKYHKSWSLIQTQDGQEGWINSSRVTTVSSAVQAMGAAGLVDLHMVGGAKDGTQQGQQPLQNLGTIVSKHYGSTFVQQHDARLIIGAIAQLNEGRVAIYYKNNPHQLSWWERWLLDEQGENARRTYQDIRVRDGLNLVLPKKSLIEQMKASGALSSGSIKEQYKGLMDGIKMYGGYLVGIPEGLWKGLVGTLKAIPELLKLLWKTLKAAVQGTLLAHLQKLWDGLVKFVTNIPASADKWWQAFKKKSPFEQGRELGKGVGMIAFEVLLALFTGAAGNALKAAAVTGRLVAKGSQVAAKIKGIGGHVGTGLTKLGDKVGDLARPIVNDLKDVVSPLPSAVTPSGHRIPMRRNDLPEFQQKGGNRMHMQGDDMGGGLREGGTRYNGLGYRGSPGPYGFKSLGEFQQFGTQLQSGLAKKGHKDATLYLQGSGARGHSHAGKGHKNFNPNSDLDVAVASESLFEKMTQLGLSDGVMKTKPIEAGSSIAQQVGLDDLLNQLSKKHGRDVNVMVFKTKADALSKASESIKIPTKKDVK